MNILFLDCCKGIRGDASLAAMIDLGVDEEYIINELSKLNLTHKYELFITRYSKDQGTELKIIPKNFCSAKIYSEDAKNIILQSSIKDNVKKISLNMLLKVAEVKSKLQRMDISEVYFEEDKFISYLVNIVGLAVCLDRLEIGKTISSTVELGGGFLNSSYGLIPIPDPITIEALKDVPVSFGNAAFEATDIIGAVFLTNNVSEFNKDENFIINRAGYGTGNLEKQKTKIYLGKYKKVAVCILEAIVDDMNSEIFNYVMERLFKEDALDVHQVSVSMKKNGIGVILRTICKEESKDRLKDVILKETSALYIKEYRSYGTSLKRDYSKVNTVYGEVSIKNGYFKDDRIKCKPEYEDCRRLAQINNIPIETIYYNVQNKIRR